MSLLLLRLGKHSNSDRTPGWNEPLAGGTSRSGKCAGGMQALQQRKAPRRFVACSLASEVGLGIVPFSRRQRVPTNLSRLPLLEGNLGRRDGAKTTIKREFAEDSPVPQFVL